MEQPYFFFSLVIACFIGAGIAWLWLMTGGKQFLQMRGEPP